MSRICARGTVPKLSCIAISTVVFYFEIFFHPLWTSTLSYESLLNDTYEKIIDVLGIH